MSERRRCSSHEDDLAIVLPQEEEFVLLQSSHGCDGFLGAALGNSVAVSLHKQ